MATTTRVVLKELVGGTDMLPSHFGVEQVPAPTEAEEGGLVVDVLSISVDPYLRIRMSPTKGYAPGFTPGEPPASLTVVRVVRSGTPEHKVGDVLRGYLPWQQRQAVKKDAVAQLQPLQNPHGAPLSYFVGALGMPGMTAYSSIIKIGKPKAGETVFVSGAAGAVGQLVGQLFKNVHGCRVVGSAGSDEKVSFLTKELGFDAAFNYKTTSTRDGLAKHCPDGIDIYFDNVGGETLEAALDSCNTFARVIACGAISQYNSTPEKSYGVKNLVKIVMKQILMQGFLVGSFLAELGADFARDMPEYIHEGKVKVKEHVVEGIENVGVAFCDMMAGKNLGKMVVRVQE